MGRNKKQKGQTREHIQAIEYLQPDAATPFEASKECITALASG
jgi:hypothetical protein